VKKDIQKSKITLIELPPSAFGKLEGDKVADVYSGIPLSARAIPLLHAVLVKSGYKNVVSINPLFNIPKGKLSPDNLSRIKETDFLLISTVTRTVPQSQELALLYRKMNSKGKVIVGGSHPTALPDECCEWADVVVRGEGEKTLLELLINDGQPEGIPGVSFKKKGQVFHEPARTFLTPVEFSDLPSPYYDDITLQNRLMSTVITSRGCPYNCNYCSVTSFYGQTYRRKSNQSIMDELDTNFNLTPHKSFFFADDNFTANKVKTKELLELILNSNLKKQGHSAQVRIETADDQQLMDLMVKAGVTTIFLGVESISDATLRGYNKGVSAAKNKAAVKKLQEAGFWVHGMMMIGGDGDTPKSVRETLDWAKENLDSVQFLTPIPLPGTRFNKEMSEQGRLLTTNYYLYDGQHILIRPIHFKSYDLQTTILEMYKDFYSLRHLRHILGSGDIKREFAFRIYAHRVLSRINDDAQMQDHLRFLKSC